MTDSERSYEVKKVNDHELGSDTAGLEREIRRLNRKVGLLERDNRMLVVMNQNAEQLRRSYEAEKSLQYLYNDLLLENCPNMIFLFNEQLKLVFCSQACERLLSMENREDLIQMPFKQVFSEEVESDWVEKIYQQNLAVLEHLVPCSYDDILIFPDNRVTYVQVKVSPVIDKADICRGTVLSVDDVTELVLARQREAEASASKSSFLANMSHEIRTPMNAIKGLSELLALTELNALQRNYVTNVVSASNSLLGIINDVLDFSKIEANKIEFIEADYKLSEMISGVCNVVNVRATEKELALYIDADPRLPSVFRGDDVRIKQIITNLLSNAVKYTREGDIRFSIYMKKDDSRNWLYFEVADSGIGIRKEEMSDIFGAFSRADIHTNRHINGTGLGLAISKQLTMAMGGDIWVDSIYGQGSRFTFKVPQGISDSEPLAIVPDGPMKKVLLLGEGIYTEEMKRQLDALQVPYQCWSQEDGIGKESLEKAEIDYTHCISADQYDYDVLKQLKKKKPDAGYAEVWDMKSAVTLSEDSGTILYLPLLVTRVAEFINNQADSDRSSDPISGIGGLSVRDTWVLVVDDNEINRLVCREMLYGFSADVDCAESGAEAITLCEQKKYDLIFMDHMMPGMDGVEATQAIRSSGGINENTPIVALTANLVNDMKSYYLESGMDDLIGKPMSLSDMHRVLVRWLSNEKLN